MYYLDFVSYRDNGKSLTGDVYKKLDYGSVGNSINFVLSGMQSKDKIEIGDSREDGEYDRVKFIPKKDVNSDVFKKDELFLLKKINDFFLHYSRQKIVNQTYDEAPWMHSVYYNNIDYNLCKDIDII